MSILDATHWQPADGMTPDEAFLLHRDAHSAAHERCKSYMRLYTRHGRYAHLSPPWGHPGYILCPVEPKSGEWLGTGSQDEYELAIELETCPRCRKAFLDSQRCGNPECPCQKWGAKLPGGERP